MAGKKLPNSVIDERVQKCYDLRYKGNETFTHIKWIDYCHNTYGDKSEQQYTDYWMKASNLHKDYWREKLDSHITPAVDKMIELLASDDEKVAQKAIEQIMKYSGNEIQKIDLEARVNVINVSFGE